MLYTADSKVLFLTAFKRKERILKGAAFILLYSKWIRDSSNYCCAVTLLLYGLAIANTPAIAYLCYT